MKSNNLLISIVIIILSQACGLTPQAAKPSIVIFEKNLEEGRLTPTVALATDFLNEYSHPLPHPKNQPLDIHIDFENPKVLAQGQTSHFQIGLATKMPDIGESLFHIVVYSLPKNHQLLEDDATSEVNFINEVVATTSSRLSSPDSKLTLDWINKPDRNRLSEPKPLLVDNDQTSLYNTFRSLSHAHFSPGSNRIILIVGKHESLTRKEKQNIVDMMGILHAKAVSLSVLAIGEKAEVAFLKTISQRTQGLFTLKTKYFNSRDWIEDELISLHASHLSDLKISIELQQGVRFARIKAPVEKVTDGYVYRYSIPKLTYGREHVFLAEYKVPASQKIGLAGLVKVGVSFFDEASQRYITLEDEGKMVYVKDRRELPVKPDTSINRSLLILDTKQVLLDIEQLIKSKRYYKAIAMLTKQEQRMLKVGQPTQDHDLLLDARILANYSDRLYNFENEGFQTIKIWRDLSQNRERYTETFD